MLWFAFWFESGFLHCAAHYFVFFFSFGVSSFGRNDEFFGVFVEDKATTFVVGWPDCISTHRKSAMDGVVWYPCVCAG